MWICNPTVHVEHVNALGKSDGTTLLIDNRTIQEVDGVRASVVELFSTRNGQAAVLQAEVGGVSANMFDITEGILQDNTSSSLDDVIREGEDNGSLHAAHIRGVGGGEGSDSDFGFYE